MAKNQNSIEKRRREIEKKRKAEEKRERRRKKNANNVRPSHEAETDADESPDESR